MTPRAGVLPTVGTTPTIGVGEATASILMSGMDVAIWGRASVSSHTKRRSVSGASVDKGVGTNSG